MRPEGKRSREECKEGKRRREEYEKGKKKTRKE
jgi:hypothetical protein